MPLPLVSPPKSVCLLRLSAAGDISHTLPVLRTLQNAWPQTRITWIIGKTEHGLVYDIPGVEFITFDKTTRWAAYVALHRALRGRRFDVLLHMQMSLRASLASLLVRADLRLGFDRARAKDLQWLFTNARIAPGGREHVIDSLLGFTRALGITDNVLRWDIPLPRQARDYALQVLPGDQPTLVISPCSSMAYRNWHIAGYAALADYAAGHHGLRVVLTGGLSTLERDYGKGICRAAQHPPLNLIGQTSLKALLAVLARATVVVSPDAGPAHLATALATPVIGLYAATNPDRARPYLSAKYVVNRYPEAVQANYAKSPEQLPWGIRVRTPGTMERITVEEVTAMLDRVLAAQRPPG